MVAVSRQSAPGSPAQAAINPEVRRLREQIEVLHSQYLTMQRCMRTAIRPDTGEVRLDAGDDLRRKPGAVVLRTRSANDVTWLDDAAPAPLLPNPGTGCLSLKGQPVKVVGFVVLGVDRARLQEVVDMVAAQQAASRDFVPLFITDSTDLSIFRAHGFAFERLPPPDVRGSVATTAAWPEVLDRRIALIRAKWGIGSIVSFSAKTDPHLSL